MTGKIGDGIKIQKINLSRTFYRYYPDTSKKSKAGSAKIDNKRDYWGRLMSMQCLFYLIYI